MEWFENPAAKFSPISQFDGGIPEVKLVQPLSLLAASLRHGAHAGNFHLDSVKRFSPG